jgi:hypothetical protein
MFKQLIATLTLSVIWLSLQAQLLDTDKRLFSDEPFFNEAFVRNNNIKSISTEHHFKPDKEKMYPKGVTITYDFSPNGKLTRQFTRFRVPGGGFDTSFIYYEYDQVGRWVTKRTTDNFGFFSLTYVYDARGNVVEEIYSRELNANQANSDFLLAKQYPMGIEKYEISYITSNFFKKKFLNNLGVPFKEISYATNADGKVTEETSTFITTRMLERKTYKYDDNGKLIEREEYTDVNRDVLLTFQYSYNAEGCLLDIKKLKNGQQVYVTEFMSNEKGIITAKLARDNEAKMIDVVKFSYEYY